MPHSKYPMENPSQAQVNAKVMYLFTGFWARSIPVGIRDTNQTT